jgi:lysophospholipase L1-like esterase
MSKKHRILAWLAAFVVGAGRLAADFQIRDGDRVVFLGDSITEQRLYTTYIEAYALTRHPEWKLSFRNVGWGGDTAWLRQRAHPDEGQLFKAEGEDLSARVTDSVGRGLGRDVLPLRPTFVTVKFGMNDHSYQKFRPDIFRAYVRSQKEIATVLGKNGARVAFLTPQPIEERRPDPDMDERNQSLRQFSDGLKEVATAAGASFVDQFDPFMKLMLAARAQDPKAVIGGGDAVHPGPSGQTLMAWAVLKGLGAEPLVSSAEIDVDAKSAKAAGCRIDGLKVDGGGVSFDRLDSALPLPIDARAEAALKLAPVLDDLSRLELKITGLAAGTYEVTIDGESAGRVESSALAAGWNFSNAAGPITRQAREVLAAVFEKNNRFFGRWRDVQLYSFPGWAAGPEIEARRKTELGKIDAAIAALEVKLDGLRKPKAHRFEVKPVQP